MPADPLTYPCSQCCWLDQPLQKRPRPVRMFAVRVRASKDPLLWLFVMRLLSPLRQSLYQSLRLVEMLAEIRIEPEVSCLATTPADIQWMVQSSSGLALIDQKTPLDPSLTTRPIANVNWTVDTAFVHPVGAERPMEVDCLLAFAVTLKFETQLHRILRRDRIQSDSA